MGLLGEIADIGKGVIESNLKWTERAAKVGGQMVDLSQQAASFLSSQLGPRLIRGARSPILVAGQQTIESMKHSTGVGDPEDGQRFGAGADTMGAVGQVLVSAFPDDSWDSSGASAYAGRNTEQVGRVQTMLGLDNMVAGVLSTEAGQIAATRDSLDEHSDWLGAMSLLTTSAGIVPGFGTAAQMAAEFAMVAKAVGDSNSDLKTLCGHIDENAAVLQTAAAQYESLAGDASATGAEFEPPAGDPEVSTAPGDPQATDPGVPTGGGDAPSGGGGTVPSAGGGGGTPSGSSSAPAMPTSMSGTGAPSSDVAANAAGALGGILGSLVSPLSGILGGITQAFGQAAQAATQAGTQAAQMAGQAGGLADAAELDKASGTTGLDADDRDGRDDEDRDGRDEHDKDDKDAADREKDGDGEEQADEPEEGEVGGVPDTDSAGGPADPLGAGADDEAAKTLPPNLEAMAAGGAAAGPAPVHVGADFEQGQLYVAAAATLDRGVPGSAAVVDR
jgi:hypothetical protein